MQVNWCTCPIESIIKIGKTNFSRGGAQLFKNINRFIFCCDIAYDIQLGYGLHLPHQGLGVVIGPETVIGDNVTIFQHVTLGAKVNGKGYSAPTIGNNVVIGAGACILGDVHIGNNVYIGANAIVLKDVPDNCMAIGVPAQIRMMEEMK